jgi:hypothetical protein
MEFNGFQWISMDFNGFQWISMDFRSSIRSKLMQLVWICMVILAIATGSPGDALDLSGGRNEAGAVLPSVSQQKLVSTSNF